MLSRAIRALVLIGLVCVVGCGPFVERQPAPTQSVRSPSCRGAAGLLQDFVDAFNSRDRKRLGALLASNVHLVDDESPWVSWRLGDLESRDLDGRASIMVTLLELGGRKVAGSAV
jgi:hypothetical protein